MKFDVPSIGSTMKVWVADEAVPGPRLAQGLEHGLLGAQVGGGDEVAGPLLGDLQRLHLAEIAHQRARRLARGVDHHLEEGGRRGHANSCSSRRGNVMRARARRALIHQNRQTQTVIPAGGPQRRSRITASPG
jgi:hypothetical protein